MWMCVAEYRPGAYSSRSWKVKGMVPRPKVIDQAHAQQCEDTSAQQGIPRFSASCSFYAQPWELSPVNNMFVIRN